MFQNGYSNMFRRKHGRTYLPQVMSGISGAVLIHWRQSVSIRSTAAADLHICGRSFLLVNFVMQMFRTGKGVSRCIQLA